MIYLLIIPLLLVMLLFLKANIILKCIAGFLAIILLIAIVGGIIDHYRLK